MQKFIIVRNCGNNVIINCQKSKMKNNFHFWSLENLESFLKMNNAMVNGTENQNCINKH